MLTKDTSSQGFPSGFAKLRIVAAIANALHVLHGSGVVLHTSIELQNVLFNDKTYFSDVVLSGLDQMVKKDTPVKDTLEPFEATGNSAPEIRRHNVQQTQGLTSHNSCRCVFVRCFSCQSDSGDGRHHWEK